ncbi:hypothetical protein [Rubrobacter aplysinae]|uniref:hypothetical protein n=1 Tax=Rubrobacter aplysinae TaxID=909625 RepID=UPI00064C3664|nr:hypothetical protein [Rubrobacter aplysinae]
MLARLLGLSFAYGLGFTLIKSLFPSPVILMVLYGGQTSEGNLTTLSLVYMASGIIGGLVGGMIFGLALLGRKALQTGLGGGAPRVPRSAAGLSMGLGLGLSLGMAAVISIISTVLTVGAYQFGLLPSGGVLDPLTLIRSSNFSPGTPLLVLWTFARDLLPAMLAGLFLAPLGGNYLLRLYYANRPAPQDNLSEQGYLYEE